MTSGKKLSLAIALAAGTSLGASSAWAQTSPGPTNPNPNQGELQGGAADRTTPGADRWGKDSGISGQGNLSGRDRNSSSSPSLGGSTATHQRGAMRHGHGQNITKVQEALKEQGFDPGPIDGKMGPKTREALRSFQQSKNLSATGRLDAQTAQQLGVEQGAVGTSRSPSSHSESSRASDRGLGRSNDVSSGLGKSGSSSLDKSGDSGSDLGKSQDSGSGLDNSSSGSGSKSGSTTR